MALRTLCCFIFIASRVCAFAQADYINWSKPNSWVDSVYNTLSYDERIAQLIMIAAFNNRDSSHIRDVECHVREIGVGGLIFFKGNPHKQASLTNYYQSKAKVPLLIGIDGEWGISMRLDSTPVYPRQMVAGAARNEDDMYEMGRMVGRECKRMGIHWNFAPDVDVNNNPNNPVINDRSFGEDKYWVSKLAIQYARGMQDERILACAKHFPGHGDVEVDSHYGLPVIKKSRKQLDSLELYPFNQMIKANVMSIMSAHLNIPSLDTAANIPSSLSRPIITGLLKNELGYEGLVITDAMNMKGVTESHAAGEATAKALAAGNDMVEFVEDVPAALSKIKEYLDSDIIDSSQLEKSCKKILMAKYWAGLHRYEPVRLDNLTAELNCCGGKTIANKIIKEAIVIAKNKDKIIPVENPELYHIAVVSLGSGQFTTFQEMCMNYIRADYYSIDKSEAQSYFDSLYQVLSPYNLIVVSLHNTSRFVSKKLGLTFLQIEFMNRLLQVNKKVVLVNHGNPYILRQFNGLRNVIEAYEDLEEYNRASAQVLFGGMEANGVLPVTVNEQFLLGAGEKPEALSRFAYKYPEEIKYDGNAFRLLDSVAMEAIVKGATPGCQILVAKDRNVIYHKSFGYHTYDSTIAVQNHHLYDLASLTKILATTVAVMKLYDEKKIRLDAHLSDYLPMVKGTNKANLLIQDILMHQAGLIPFVPIYKQTLVHGNLSPVIYTDAADSNYTIRVAKDLYMHRLYEPYVWQEIIQSEVKPAGHYVYSDLGFVLLRKAIENIAGEKFETYLQKNIYQPLNLANLCFNPIDQINADWIVPTEPDSVYRKRLLHGTVHDQTAAMLGGVSGHAGLFGSANDVAIIMQMLMNGGEYGGKRVLKETTVKEFTKRHGKAHRRGLGFDKPEPDTKKASPTSKWASLSTFGHTGFTGTCTWADPKYGLVYVFLSNRVNQGSENKKLVEMNVRTRLMDTVYEIIKKQESAH